MRKAIRRWINLYHRTRTLLSWTRDHIFNMRCNKMVSRIRLGPDGLRKLSASIPDQFKTPDGQTEALALATGVLRVFLGSEWVERHVISDNSKKGFLSVKEDDPIRREISFFRLMDLAEMLWNLQRIPGFDECIWRMRNGDIEGTLAELNVGRMLYLNKIPFRFVIPQGVKKKDYDFDIICPNGQVVCADAKCKIDETSFSEGGIREAFRVARGQLPNDKPGIIFVKVPEHYLSDPSFQDKSIELAQRFLGGASRIASVKYYVEPIRFSANVMRIDLAYKEVSNPRTDFGIDVDWNLFRKHYLPPQAYGMPPHYQRIILSRFRIGPPNGQG
ncbi:hypothetical protein ACQR16_26380 [Bradyrhizobium oligotrophicum]|uniref:hypothetical protein n=1 Tax=Bradyrhizobium oligotrophicum TaxID=44255 RepID=UPI003EC0EFD1